MQVLALVGVGGAFGSIMRYLLFTSTTNLALRLNWPLATWLANVIGCFLIGLLAGYWLHEPPDQTQMLRAFFITGFCGGFTTFSAFSLEAIQLIKSGQILLAFAYVFSTVLVCLLATFVGLFFARQSF
jgi:fluoride exporter